MFEENRSMMELFDKVGAKKVLVLGLDVSKNKFTIAALNGMYEVKIKTKDVEFNKNSLNKLYQEIDHLIKKDHIKQLIFGCEPSGIYYKPIIKELIRKYPDGMFKLINPSSTKANRDQMMEREKTDSIDTYAIVDLLIRGECYDLEQEDNTFSIIREYVRELDHLTKELARLKNKIHSNTDEFYPGLESEHSSFLDSKYGKMFLKKFPKPWLLSNLSVDEWQKMLSTKEYALSRHLAVRLRERSNSIVTSKHKNFNKIKEYITFLVEGYEQLERRKLQIEESLDELIETLDFGENLKEIGGIKTLTISRIIAYTRNPYRFKDGKKVASFAGLIPKSEQSGKKDKNKILSKKGHSKLRTTLIQAAQQVITSTGYFTAYYHYLFFLFNDIMSVIIE